MNSLSKIIEKLKSSEDVDAVFITGSHGTKESRSYSDIDLVIILKENRKNLYSLFRWIDGVFADIYFFDLDDLKRIGDITEPHEDSWDEVFLEWLKKSDINFDKSGTLSELKNKTKENGNVLISTKVKNDVWQRINYNYVANKRYFESKDPLYLEALELRLLYSVLKIISGYLSLRDVAWRGEKAAVKYLKNNHLDFYNLFIKYSKSELLETRFELYSQMVNLVFT